MPPALFVVGTSRSGTSWVFDLCASHPDMSMGYESKLPVEGIEVYRRYAARLTDAADPRPVMEQLFRALHDEIDDPSSEELRSRLTRPDVVERALAAQQREPGWASVCEAIVTSLEDTTHWGNKLLRVELMPALREQWPDAKFLVLTRDPRAVLESQSKKFDYGVVYNAMYWNTHAQYVHDQIGLRPGEHDDSRIVVDLTEMARDPRPALTWAFESVGLSTEPIEDLITRFPGDPERLENWRRTMDPGRQRRIEQYCYTAMVQLGYQPELATGPRTISSAQKLLAMTQEHGAELLRDPGAIRRKQVGRRVKAALKLGS